MRSDSQMHEDRSNKVLDNAKRFAQGGCITIDERLDRLTERHEALTQTVELLSEDVRALSKEVRELVPLVKDIAIGTARLLHAVEGHEQRLSDLEEGSRSRQ